MLRVLSLSMPIMSRSHINKEHNFIGTVLWRERHDKCRATKTRRSINSFVIPAAEQLCSPDYEGNLISRELISLHMLGKDNAHFMRRHERARDHACGYACILRGSLAKYINRVRIVVEREARNATVHPVNGKTGSGGNFVVRLSPLSCIIRNASPLINSVALESTATEAHEQCVASTKRLINWMTGFKQPRTFPASNLFTRLHDLLYFFELFLDEIDIHSGSSFIAITHYIRIV